LVAKRATAARAHSDDEQREVVEDDSPDLFSQDVDGSLPNREESSPVGSRSSVRDQQRGGERCHDEKENGDQHVALRSFFLEAPRCSS
jgi:hypothetical protein